jgi:preprotein translocase subunit SecD
VTPPQGQLRPVRYLTSLLGILAALYGLVLFTGSTNTPKLGLDLRGGTQVVLAAQTEDGQKPSKAAMNQARTILTQRVDSAGVASAEVVIQGDDRLIVSVTGENSEKAKQLSATAQLLFRPVKAVYPVVAGSTGPVTPAEASRRYPGATPEQLTLLAALDCDATNRAPSRMDQVIAACDRDGKLAYILDKALFAGTEISGASVLAPDGASGEVEWSVQLNLKSDGQRTWSRYTTEHNATKNADDIANQVAFTLDDKVVSAPRITSVINGTTRVSGQFDQQSATDLADVLRFGALPLSFTQQSALTISPSLGTDQLKAGLLAGGIGLVLVVAYSLVYYRALGLVTIASLLVSGALTYALLVILGRQIGFALTLAGVAGFIVAVGITADSFVILFERLKDEVREGRTARSAVPRAWERARRTILSADAVSFLAAVILYYFAAGEVKGFAFTLGLSTLLDLVVVFLFTHPLIAVLARSRTFTSPQISGLGAVRTTVSSAR